MNFPELTTKRTKLVKLVDEYLEDVYKIFSDELVTEYMDIYPMKSLDETRLAWINWAQDIYANGEGIRWGILFEGHIIGTCGFHNIKRADDKNIAELGYDLARSYWGQGFISEVIPAIIEYAFTTIDIDQILACIYPENIRSKKSIKRLGFKYSGIKVLSEKSKDRFLEEEVYTLNRVNSQ